MNEAYTRDLLRVAVAQICQTIGYNSTQSTPLEMLQDILHKFLIEFTRDLRRKVEHDNRTEPNLNDVGLTLNSLNVNIPDILNYINNVELVPFTTDIPKYPQRRNSNLNFLKPGSKEVLTRPVHVYEHLPPMFSDLGYKSEDDDCVIVPFQRAKIKKESKDVIILSPQISAKPFENVSAITDPSDTFPKAQNLLAIKSADDTTRQYTTEISSVVMTTGGYISPAVEGKLPEESMPEIVAQLQGFDTVADFSRPESRNSVINAPTSISAADTAVAAAIDGKIVESASNTKTHSYSTPASSNVISVGAAPANANEIHGNVKNLVSKTELIGDTHVRPTIQPSNLPAKLLKKTKKKSSSLLPGMQTKNQSVEGMDKIQKKRMKMLQKLAKSSKAPDGSKIDVIGPGGKVINPTMIANLLPGPELLQIEKILKKQIKQKQKQKMKKQQTAAFKNKNFEEIPRKQMVNVKNKLARQEKKLEAINKHTSPKSTASQHAVAELANLARNDKVMLEASSEADGRQSANPSHSDTIKLSTAPDRNKLNIFKKISKSKSAKAASPNMKMMQEINIFKDDNQIINLPSGTTITPALPESDTGVSKQSNFSTNSFVDKNACQNMQSFMAEAAAQLSMPLPQSGSMVNAPKKRGRKPGSKNQVKPISVTTHLAENPSSKKKKKLSMEAAAAAAYMQKNQLNMEPMNLSYPSEFLNSQDFVRNLAMGFPMPYPTSVTSVFPANFNQQKESKKLKNKFTFSDPMTFGENAKKYSSGMIKDNSVSNKSLHKMESSLNDNEHTASLSMTVPVDNIKTAAVKHSPTTSLTSMKPLGLKKNQQHMPQAGMLPTTQVPSTFMPQGDARFSALSAGILPMLPLCSFPTQPGLIPSSPLFPNPTMSHFHPNSKHTSASNVLLPPFMPFSKLVAASTADIPNKEVAPLELVSQLADRNFCNVAPLVPESMNLTSPNFSEKPPSYATDPAKGRQPTNLSGVEMLKKLQYNNLAGAVGIDKQAGIGSAELYKNFESLARSHLELDKLGKSMSQFAPEESKFTSQPTVLGKAMLSNSTILNDPIEVSDDSNDVTPTSKNAAGFSQQANSVKAKTSVQQKGLIDGNNKMCSEGDFKNEFTKKMKKINKTSKKNSFNRSPAISNVPLNMLIGDKGAVGVSKLAGGADLIPLSSTGLAYSSKSIPSTSLTGTASTALVKQDFETPSVYNSLTITPTAAGHDDVQKRKKEHKKLKRLKDGKVKKKKDKKDKSKEKERSEKYVLNNEQPLVEKDLTKLKAKDALKKFKKEKRKDKQRTSTNVNAATSVLSLEEQTHMTDCIDATKLETNAAPKDLNSSELNTNCSNSNTVASSASLVPKLTLRLGACQSPTLLDNAFLQPLLTPPKIDVEKREPSPELARISPLITRPQKQKFNPSTGTATHSPTARSLPLETTVRSIELSTDGNSSSTPTNSATSMHSLQPPPSPWVTEGTLTASSVLLPQQLMQGIKAPAEQSVAPPATDITGTSVRAAELENPSPIVPLVTETSRPSSYIDAEGNRVWICPACGKVDDGSAMIGCDGCDAWYHWVCVGISVAPKDNEDWFCRVCTTKKRGVPGSAADKKRKRNKRK